METWSIGNFRNQNGSNVPTPDKRFFDTCKKEIGDIVKIIDNSSVTAIDGELDPIDYENLCGVKNEFIVIANREKVIYKSYFKDYCQDLIIVNRKTNVQYRVISNHVRIV